MIPLSCLSLALSPPAAAANPWDARDDLPIVGVPTPRVMPFLTRTGNRKKVNAIIACLYTHIYTVDGIIKLPQGHRDPQEFLGNPTFTYV